MVCVVRNVMADTLGSSETIENPPREYTEARKIELSTEFSRLDGYYIVGIGNMVGWGEQFIQDLKKYRA